MTEMCAPLDVTIPGNPLDALDILECDIEPCGWYEGTLAYKAAMRRKFGDDVILRAEEISKHDVLARFSGYVENAHDGLVIVIDAPQYGLINEKTPIAFGSGTYIKFKDQGLLGPDLNFFGVIYTGKRGYEELAIFPVKERRIERS